MFADHGLWDNPEVWGFMGVVAIQVSAVVLLLLNRQGHRLTQSKLGQLEMHVNNVEVDINHTSDDVTLGQRVKRMEQTQAHILRILED